MPMLTAFGVGESLFASMTRSLSGYEMPILVMPRDVGFAFDVDVDLLPVLLTALVITTPLEFPLLPVLLEVLLLVVLEPLLLLC